MILLFSLMRNIYNGTAVFFNERMIIAMESYAQGVSLQQVTKTIRREVRGDS